MQYSIDKRSCRKAARQYLKTLSAADHRRAGELAAVELAGRPEFHTAELVLAFLSMPDELDTVPILELTLRQGKIAAVPRIIGDDIEFVALTEDWKSWPPDAWNIPVPPEQLPALSVQEITQSACLMLLPGLAFDRAGRRLGRGKGFYDRFQAELSAARSAAVSPAPLYRLGLCHAGQLLPDVPAEAHDFTVDAVLAIG